MAEPILVIGAYGYRNTGDEAMIDFRVLRGSRHGFATFYALHDDNCILQPARLVDEQFLRVPGGGAAYLWVLADLPGRQFLALDPTPLSFQRSIRHH